MSGVGKKNNVSNVTVEEHARSSEILVAYLLTETVFKGKKLIVGDGGNKKRADINARDNSLAVEVVSCEIPTSRTQSSYYYGIDDITTLFSKELRKKMEKLNKDNYENSPENIYLAIDSMIEMSSFVEADIGLEIYKSIAKDYRKRFIDLIILNKFGVTMNEHFTQYEFDHRQYVLDLECKLLIDLEKYE